MNVVCDKDQCKRPATVRVELGYLPYDAEGELGNRINKYKGVDLCTTHLPPFTPTWHHLKRVL